MQFKNVFKLLDHFKEEAVCKEYLEQKRWNGTPTCHHCGSTHVYRTNRGFKCGNKECKKKFSVLTGSIYENTKLPLRIWFASIFLITTSKKGISSLQLSRQLGISQKSAWHLLHRIRVMLTDKAPSVPTNHVQIDESYVGGKEHNKHASKKAIHKLGKAPRGRSQTKTPVIGLYEKDGRVKTFVVENATRRIAEKIISENVEIGSTMVTDAFPMYNRIGKKYNHVIVNHSAGIYVDANNFHTNNIENFWSLLKRGIIGVYHYVSPKHLHRYCNEFSGRYNTRKISDTDRFELSVENCDGRLKFQDLIK